MVRVRHRSSLMPVPEPMTRRLAAIVLVSQALVIVFAATGARALADATDSAAAGSHLLLGTGLTVLTLVAAGLLRTRFGVPLGWLVQLACLAGYFVLPAMLLVGAVFGSLWLLALRQGRKMDALTRTRAAAADVR